MVETVELMDLKDGTLRDGIVKDISVTVDNMGDFASLNIITTNGALRLNVINGEQGDYPAFAFESTVWK